jgi:hypothetical protein
MPHSLWRQGSRALGLAQHHNCAHTCVLEVASADKDEEDDVDTTWPKTRWWARPRMSARHGWGHGDVTRARMMAWTRMWWRGVGEDDSATRARKTARMRTRWHGAGKDDGTDEDVTARRGRGRWCGDEWGRRCGGERGRLGIEAAVWQMVEKCGSDWNRSKKIEGRKKRGRIYRVGVISRGLWPNAWLNLSFGARRNCCLHGSFISRPCNNFRSLLLHR